MSVFKSHRFVPRDPAKAEEEMKAMRHRIDVGNRGSEGFALIVAILALTLLTLLGITLSVTTTTEVQIAANYKRSQQALYNAEAGLEVGKRVLQNMVWDNILPVARGTWSCSDLSTPSTCTPPSAPASRYTGAARDRENTGCDLRANAGYGIVLNDGTTVYENISTVPGMTSIVLPGTFTLWIRRPVIVNQVGTLQDYNTDNSTLVLTAEGTAPFTSSTATRLTTSARAVRVMEMTLTRNQNYCDGRAAQVGGGAEGNNKGDCSRIDNITANEALSDLGGQLSSGTQAGTGAEKSAGAL
jgi:hypothetical protein